MIVVLPDGSSDASRVSASTRIIASNTAWGGYCTSVDAIEQATGYELLSAVPAAIQSTIEARTDSSPTN